MTLGMGNNGNGGNGSAEVQGIVPTVGAGWTGMDISPSDLGPAGNVTLAIVDDIHSEDGTYAQRLSGGPKEDYALGRGGAEDIFRDFLGKVWTEEEIADIDTLTFLNPKMGVNSSDVSLNMPCDVYVDAAQLVSDSLWPEYTQKVFIDPDIHWLYDKIVPVAFPNEVFNQDVKGVVIKHFSNPTEGFVDLEAEVVHQAQKIIPLITKWWKTVFRFEDAPIDPHPLLLHINAPLISFNTSYDDYGFTISTPYTVEEANKMLGLKPIISNLNTVYNFYINDYECLISNAGVKTQIIPNIYAFISAYIPEKKGNEIHHTSKKFEDLISLNYLLQGYDGSSLVSTPYKFGESQTLIPAAANNYYRSWATTIKGATPDELLTLDPLAKRYSNILFPMDDTGMLKYYNNLKFMFPMYNELKFSTGILTQFGDLMRSTKLAQHFMHYYYVTENTGGIPNGPIKKQKHFILQNKTQQGTFISDKKSITVMGLEAWMASLELFDVLGQEDEFPIDLSLLPAPEFFNENAVFMTTNKNEDMIEIKSSNELERSILGAILFGKTRKIAKSYIRHYGDLCRGKTAYSETLMYKVSKYIDSTTSPKIQTFYFLNSSEIDVLKFIDTQASYNTKYIYDISAVQLVLGTEYHYHVKPNFASNKAGMPDTLQLYPSEEAKAAHAEQQTVVAGGGVDQGTALENLTDPNAIEACTKEKDLVSPDNPYFGLKDPCGCAQVLIKENITKDEACAQGYLQCCPDVTPNIGAGPGAGGAGGGGAGGAGGSGGGGSGGSSTPDLGGLPDTGTSLLTSIPVVYKPQYNIVEIPYTRVEGIILDKPPVFPDVNIVPYKGINNKVLVNLNSSVGEYDMMPIAFNGEEEKEIGLLREAQKVAGTKPIKYKSDDTIAYGGFFQIYRMEKKPETYKDFDKHLIQTIRTQAGLLYSEAASIVDDIKPNKKYYYTFRVVDVHGNSSNPTEVFEIEMIDDNGTVYFRQRVIELEPIENKMASAPLKKYVHIRPTLAQRVLDEDGMDLSNAESAFEYTYGGGKGMRPKLGMKDESVWSKKFKIRFTSKSTGKQIDLNVNFVVTNQNELQDLAAQIKEAAVVQGVQASAGGVVNPIDMEKSGQPGNPLEGG